MTSPSCRFSRTVELQPVLHGGAHHVGDEHRHARGALADQVAVRVDDADRIVLVLVDVWAERRARDVDVDFVGDGDKTPPDHLDGDRIDRCGAAAQPMPAWRQWLQSMSISPSLPMVNVSRGPMSVLDPYSTISAGPCPLKPGVERIAIIDLRRQEPILLEKEDRPRLQLRAPGRRTASAEPGGRSPAASCAGSQANAARRSRPRPPNWRDRSVAGIPGRSARAAVRHRRFRERDLDRMMLALVAHLGLALDRDRCRHRTRGAAPSRPCGLELGVDAIRPWRGSPG